MIAYLASSLGESMRMFVRVIVDASSNLQFASDKLLTANIAPNSKIQVPNYTKHRNIIGFGDAGKNYSNKILRKCTMQRTSFSHKFQW